MKIALGLLLMPLGAEAFQLGTTADGVTTRWAAPTVPYAVSSTMTGVGPAARRAFDAWGAARGSELEARWTGTTTQAAARGIVRVAELPADRPFDAALAVTAAIYGPGSGEIRGAELLLNTRAHRFDGSPGAFDLDSVLLHEAGHALGLAHSCDVDGSGALSCFDLDALSARERARIQGAAMFPSLSMGAERRAINADDEAGLATLYPGGRGAPPVIGALVEACPERAWRVPVTAADRVEIELRFEDGATRPAEVRAREADAVIIAPVDAVADVVARDPATGSAASQVAQALSPPACAPAEEPDPVEAPDGGCSSVGSSPLLALVLALKRRRS